MIDEGHREGPRERALHLGIDALADAELVAILLGTGRAGEPVSVLAGALLDELGGVRGLGRAGIGEVAARAGVGNAKAARIAAAIEIGRRCCAAATDDAPPLPDSGAVAAWSRSRLAWLDHEELWGLALDGRSRLRAARRLAIGSLSALHVATRDPLRAMVREGASAFILVHNHPSGDATPSESDVTFTFRIEDAADLLGMPLVDHVVVSRHGHVSLFERGLLRRNARSDIDQTVIRTSSQSRP